MRREKVMNRRKAITLIEVLVALFVMAIGLLAVITLFPLGGLTMAQAIKDDRAATAANNGAAVAEMTNLRFDSGDRDSIRTAYYDPGGGLSPISEDADGPSYPVLIDPVGVRSGFGTTLGMSWPRREPRFTEGQFDWAVYQWFTMLDDMAFEETGAPKLWRSRFLQRESIYSWAFLLRRPRCGTRSVVDLTVLVFRNRPLQLTPSLSPVGEAVYQTPGVVPKGSRTVSLTSPRVRRGDWIVDITPEQTPPGRLAHGPAHAYFYRIVGTTPGSGGVTHLELQHPLRANASRFLLWQNLVEVFDKGPGWRGG
jgi:hypothetical protein